MLEKRRVIFTKQLCLSKSYVTSWSSNCVSKTKAICTGQKDGRTDGRTDNGQQLDDSCIETSSRLAPPFTPQPPPTKDHPFVTTLLAYYLFMLFSVSHNSWLQLWFDFNYCIVRGTIAAQFGTISSIVGWGWAAGAKLIVCGGVDKRSVSGVSSWG